jgi:hypothetical protein
MAPTRDDDGPHQPPKRRKVAESCKVCRAKKTKCDGRRPDCSPCTAKDIACEYNDPTVPVSAGSLADIEKRLQKLEQQATVTRVDYPPHTGGSEYPSRSSGLLGESSSVLNLCPPNPVSHSDQPLHLERAASLQGSPNPDSSGPDFETERPLTEHSTMQFIRDLTQIADPQPATKTQSSLWRKSTIETDTSFMVVPKRAVADDLLDCYENYVYPLFPILHMPTFRKSYEGVWERKTQAQSQSLQSEATFYATLNIVFALGCLSNSKVKQQLKLQTADAFYRRARALLPLDALNIPSLEVVQSLLLTASYLSFTKYSNRCCNTLAVAIRVAQAIGLHMDVTSSSSNQLEREMNRRVWHHCLVLERFVHPLPLPCIDAASGAKI